MLKISINTWDSQLEKAQTKTGVILQDQSQSKASQVEQRTETSEKARKKKKQKTHRARRDRDGWEGSTPVSETNTTPTKKKIEQNQDQNYS